MEKKRKADIYAEEIAAGMSVKDVAEKYGVTRSAVYCKSPSVENADALFEAIYGAERKNATEQSIRQFEIHPGGKVEL